MATAREYIVKINHIKEKRIKATGNLAAFLTVVFGHSHKNNLDRCNISISKDGRLQANYNKTFYTVSLA